MIFDEQNLYSDGQAVTATNTSSTNLIDHFKDTNDATTGAGEGMNIFPHIYIQVTKTFTGAGTIAATLEECDTIGGTYNAILTGPTTAAAPAAGTVLLDARGARVTKRYTRINYLEPTGGLAAGEVTAGIIGSSQAGVPTT
jgi:hypothetical protein